MDDLFKSTWDKMKPNTKDGLFRELFSKPTDQPNERYHTLDFESKHYTTFINVGIWRSLGDFESAINSMIPGRYPSTDIEKGDKDTIDLFKFEFKLRERLVMDVEKIRGGEWNLPDAEM